MKYLFQILDIIGAVGLFIFAFFAVLTGVVKELAVAVLVILMVYTAVRLVVRVRTAS